MPRVAKGELAGEVPQPDNVVAMVLCGGLGTRLRSLTGEEIPKALYPVVGKPIIEHSIEPLVRAGISKVVLTTAYGDEAIRKHFEGFEPPQSSRTIIDFTNQREPTGVLPGVAMAMREHSGSITDSTMVCDGDAIRLGLDVGALYAYHKTSGRNTTLVTTSVSQTERHWGIIGDEEGDLVEIAPFPETGTVPGNIVFTGCMMLDSRGTAILRETPSENSSWTGMTALLQEHGTVNHYYSEMDYFNLNSPDVVDEAECTLRSLGGIGVQGYMVPYVRRLI